MKCPAFFILILFMAVCPLKAVSQNLDQSRKSNPSLVSNPERSPSTSGLKVGRLGQLENIELEGNQTFTGAQLKDVLRVHPDFLSASHPLAPLEAFIETNEKILKLGYLGTGFPDVKVEVVPEISSEKIRVILDEGERHFWRGVVITGEGSRHHAKIRELMTKPVKTPGETDSSLWNPVPEFRIELGSGANFRPRFIEEVRDYVKSVLAAEGFGAPDFNVTIDRNDVQNTADLRIHLKALGLPARVGEIKVNGLVRNSKEDLLRFLGVEKGINISPPKVEEWNRRLREAAIFSLKNIKLRDPDPKGFVDVEFDLLELKSTPLLYGEKDRNYTAIRKMVSWFSTFKESTEDLRLIWVFDSDHPDVRSMLPFLKLTRDIRLEVNVSPASPLAAQISARIPDSDPEWDPILSLAITGKSANLYSHKSREKYVVPHGGRRLMQFFLKAKPDPTEEAPDNFNMELGFGFDSSQESPDSVQDTLPLEMVWDLDPAAALKILPEVDVEFRNERCVITTKKGIRVEFTESTGQLLSLESGKSNSSFELTADSGANLFSTFVKDLFREMDLAEDQYDVEQPTRSLLRFLANLAPVLGGLTDYAVQSDGPGIVHAAKTLDKIIDEITRYPTDQKGVSNPPKNSIFGFVNPNQLVDGEMQRFAYLMFILFQDSLQDFVASDSWAADLLRNFPLLILNQSQYARGMLAHIIESEKIGPIGTWTTVELMERLDMPEAREAASRRKAEWTREAFLRDSRIFIHETSPLARFIDTLYNALKARTDDEVASLLSVIPGKQRTKVTAILALIRTAGTEDHQKITEEILSGLWEDTLAERMDQDLWEIETQIARLHPMNLIESARKLLSAGDFQGAFRYLNAGIKRDFIPAIELASDVYLRGPAGVKDAEKALALMEQGMNLGSVWRHNWRKVANVCSGNRTHSIESLSRLRSNRVINGSNIA